MITFEFGAGNIVSYSKETAFIVQVINDESICIYAIAMNQGGAPYRVLRATHHTQLRDQAGDAIAGTAIEVRDTLLDIITTIGIIGVNFSYQADNFTALITEAPVATDGQLAYVRNSQGISWLPGSIGGTYYPSGIYLYVSGQWVSSRNQIAGQLQTLVDYSPTEDEKAALSGTSGTPSATNKYVTDEALMDALEAIGAQLDSIELDISDLFSLAPTAGQKLALAGSSGAPGTDNKYVTEAGLSSALAQAGTPVTRPINSTPFTPHATKYVRGSYTIQISATLNLGGSQIGTIFLEVDIAGVWTEVSRFSYTSSGTLALGLNLTTVLVAQLNGFFSPNQSVRLRSTGTATMTYVAGQESTIG